MGLFWAICPCSRPPFRGAGGPRRLRTPAFMNASASSSRQIAWPSVITVISAASLIGAEVFGAAFAGGWALAILFGLGDQGTHILQAVLFALGVLVMTAFIR